MFCLTLFISIIIAPDIGPGIIIIISIVGKIAIGGIGSMMVIITNAQTTATPNTINKKCLV